MTGKRIAIYCRVSTQDQDPDCQIRALREYATKRGFSITQEYVDVVTGSFEKRSRKNLKAPAYEQLMADARAHKIDCVVVWKYDRFSRSLFALMSALREFGSLGVDFISTTQDIDTTTPSGRLLFHIMGCFAEFEREQIIERTKMGLAKARALGKLIGRQERDPSARERILELRSAGFTFREIGAVEGFSSSAVARIIQRPLKPKKHLVPAFAST